MQYDDICYKVSFFDGEKVHVICVGSSHLAGILMEHGLDSGYHVNCRQDLCDPDEFVLR